MTHYIEIDGKKRLIPKVWLDKNGCIKGLHIKAIDGIDPTYQIVLDSENDSDDILIRDYEKIKLKKGMKFYAIPPAIMANDSKGQS